MIYFIQPLIFKFHLIYFSSLEVRFGSFSNAHGHFYNLPLHVQFDSSLNWFSSLNWMWLEKHPKLFWEIVPWKWSEKWACCWRGCRVKKKKENCWEITLRWDRDSYGDENDPADRGQLTGRCPCMGENRQIPCMDGGEGLRCRLERSLNTTVGVRSSVT